MKMRITNEILDVWGISKETLRENAIQNMPDPVFLPLWQVLRGQPEEPANGFYQLTNQIRINGAAELMRPEVLEMVGETLKGDYFVLPSWADEVLCIQSNGKIPVENLQDILCQAYDERLSDAVWYYNCSSKQLYDVRTENDLKELKDSLEKSAGKKEQRKKKYR